MACGSGNVPTGYPCRGRAGLRASRKTSASCHQYTQRLRHDFSKQEERVSNIDNQGMSVKFLSSMKNAHGLVLNKSESGYKIAMKPTTDIKEKAIIESFAKTFNKIKRINENELTEDLTLQYADRPTSTSPILEIGYDDDGILHKFGFNFREDEEPQNDFIIFILLNLIILILSLTTKKIIT